MITPENRRCNPDRFNLEHTEKLSGNVYRISALTGHSATTNKIPQSVTSNPNKGYRPQAPDNLWLNIFRIQKSAGYLCPLRLYKERSVSQLISCLLAGALALLSPQIQADNPEPNGQLTTGQLKMQCQPLMEGSQSLMSAFQSGQCSSYILGIYDLVAQQCPGLGTHRNDAVRNTLAHLSQLPDDHADQDTPAVRTINRFLSAQAPCLPVASL